MHHPIEAFIRLVIGIVGLMAVAGLHVWLAKRRHTDPARYGKDTPWGEGIPALEYLLAVISIPALVPALDDIFPIAIGLNLGFPFILIGFGTTVLLVVLFILSLGRFCMALVATKFGKAANRRAVGYAASIVMFSFGLPLILWSQLGGRPVWTPIVMPVSLEEGRIVTASFHATGSATYRLALEVERSGDDIRQYCRLGIGQSHSPKRCGDIESEVAIDCVVASDGQQVTVAPGVLGEGDGRYLSVTLGTINAESGHTYDIEWKVRRTAQELAKWNPRLMVEVDSEYWEGLTIMRALAAIAAVIFLGAGAAILVITRSRSRPKQPENQSA